MKTSIRLDEEDLKKIIQNYFRGLKEADVAFSVSKNVERGETSYSIRAEVTTEEKIVMY